jgi:hypothetical protein
MVRVRSQGVLLLSWALGLVSALPSGSMALGPAVFWVSTPVHPGEMVLFYGDGLEKVDDIYLIRLADEPTDLPDPSSSFQSSPAEGLPCNPLQPSSVSGKCVIPGHLQRGELVAYVHTPNGWSKPIFLNRPDPW